MNATRDRCPACQEPDLVAVVEVENQPVHSCLLWDSLPAAVEAPRGDIRLSFCRACGMIYNAAFDPSLLAYSAEYENSLHYSSRFQEYAERLASRLVERYALRGKNIVEIGCGAGEFLALLCGKGGSRGIGFDPSYPGGRDTEESGRLTFIRDVYSEAYAGYVTDLLCCRHVLEHIAEPREFLLQVRRALGKSSHAIVYCEVPDALYMLRDLSIGDIIYEHCSYFCGPALARLFEEIGFTVLDVYTAFGAQYLALEASPAPRAPKPGMKAQADLTELSDLVMAFGERYRRKMHMWRRTLRELAATKDRIVMWGAGAKGVTFLNTGGGEARIDYVVDINPRKQGTYIAGSGQQIVSPEFLRDYRPDAVLVMNPLYEEEIRATITRLRIVADILPL